MRKASLTANGSLSRVPALSTAMEQGTWQAKQVIFADDARRKIVCGVNLLLADAVMRKGAKAYVVRSRGPLLDLPDLKRSIDRAVTGLAEEIRRIPGLRQRAPLKTLPS